MGEATHFDLTKRLDRAVRDMCKPRPRGLRRIPPVPGVDPEDELALFADYDAVIGRGDGYFSFDEAERHSRRLDMRGPTDFDPGPIEMEEAPEPGSDVILLDFGDQPPPNSSRSAGSTSTS